MTKKTSKGTALITGGAKRIGKSICLHLASLGYQIALHYHHSKEEAERVAKMIKAKGGKCQLFACDLSDPTDTSTLIKNVKKKCPSLNTLINNASIFEKAKLKDAPLLSLQRHFSTNFQGPFLLTQQFANICKKGHIINLLDTSVVQNKTTHLTYAISKKALFELTKLSAKDLAPKIRVNGVAPGLILPPPNEQNSYLQRMAKHIPLKTKGDANQIARTIEFLLTTPFITGQVIFVDGGEHLL